MVVFDDLRRERPRLVAYRGSFVAARLKVSEVVADLPGGRLDRPGSIVMCEICGTATEQEGGVCAGCGGAIVAGRVTPIPQKSQHRLAVASVDVLAPATTRIAKESPTYVVQFIVVMVAIFTVITIVSQSHKSASRTQATVEQALTVAVNGCADGPAGSRSSGATPVVLDSGRTVTMDGQGRDEASGMTRDMQMCVLYGLKAPGYVISHISDTRALDGMQTDAWGEYQARWTYHPDSGLNLTVIRKS